MIEILVVRDPDMADEITVWIDGVEVGSRDDENECDVLRVAYVDAGAGYDYEDWESMATSVIGGMDSTAARAAVTAAFLDPPGKKHIDGFPEEEDE